MACIYPLNQISTIIISSNNIKYYSSVKYVVCRHFFYTSINKVENYNNFIILLYYYY